MSQTIHSFVIPVFNEQEVLPELKKRLIEGLSRPLEARGEWAEFILVDDGSRDNSRKILKELHEQDPTRFKAIFFSRNFGHQIAITAGLDLARGDTVTVMDADLQDPPEVVLKMIDQWRQGFDVVYGVREKRKDETFFKKFTAAVFYRALRKATNLEIPLDTGDFRLMSKKAAAAMRSLKEQHRFVRGLAKWVGFKQSSVMYVREARFAGETKYPLKKMLKLAWDAFTGFSLVPLRLATYVGVFAAVLSIIVAGWTVYVRLFTNHAVQGWSSLMIATLFLGGAQLFSMGILGEYVGRIFEESKRRPLYIIEEVLGELHESQRS